MCSTPKVKPRRDDVDRLQSRVVGRPGRAASLMRFLDYVLA
jgi:hypothetical protein